MDTRTTAQAVRDATQATTKLLAIHEYPYINHLAQNTARLIVAALADEDVVAAEALLDEALEMSEDTPLVHDIVVEGAKAARRFIFLAETDGR